MIKKTLAISFILTLNHAYAQSNLETSLESSWDSRILDYVEKHFSASYHGEMYGIRKDYSSDNQAERSINDFKIIHNPTIIYKPAANWQLLTTAEFKYSDQSAENAGAAYPNSFYRALVTLTRKNILSEKEQGINMDLGIGRRQFNTGAKQQIDGDYALPSYGNNRVFSNLSKKLGDISSSLFVQYLHNDYKKTTDTTWKHSLELVPSITIPITERLSYMMNDDIILNTAKTNNTDSPYSITHEMNVGVLTYQWNDKISNYYQLKYYHVEGFSKAFQSQDDFLEHYAGITYAFTEKNSLTFEVGSELAHARDERDGFSKKVAYPELALYIDLAI